MKLFDVYKHVFPGMKAYSGEIGLEIETESKKAYEVPLFSYWNTHNDGSLRDFGIEYVLKQPVSMEIELDSALKEWDDKIKKFEIKLIKDSITTSVHVHLNMLNQTFLTLVNFLVAYTIVENLLIRYSGPDRRSNLFCLPMCDAGETVNNIRDMLSSYYYNKNYGYRFNENQVKYAALNLAALTTYGSIEIRSFRGDTDIKKIRTWVDILYDIYTFAQKDTDPKEMLEQWKKEGMKFLERIFTKDHLKEILIPNAEELVKENIWNAAVIAYSVKGDWREINTQLKPPLFKPKEKELNDAAKALISQSTTFDALTEAQKEYILKFLKNKHEKDFILSLNSGYKNKKSAPERVIIERIPQDRDGRQNIQARLVDNNPIDWNALNIRELEAEQVREADIRAGRIEG